MVGNDPELFKSLVASLGTSPDLYSHSLNVTVYSMALSSRLGNDDAEIHQELATGAFLHDLGKSAISQSIIEKDSELNSAEWEEFRRHPNGGRRMAARAGISSAIVLDVIQHHHETFGGTGYPDGLAGTQISEESRIVAIADGFDALTCDRPWRSRHNVFESLVIMRDEMADSFDRVMLKEFIQILGELLSA